MAKMKLSPTVDAISGRLGNIVHRQLWGDHVLSRPPDFSLRVLSPKQLAQNNKYKQAALIWKGLPAQLKAAYREWGRRINKPPYALFNQNYSSPPSVEDIDLSQYHGQAGHPILVRAVDLFEVAAVEVTVRRTEGDIVEKGPAAQNQSEPQAWLYAASVAVPAPASLVVEAVALNWAGGQGRRMQLVSLDQG